MSEHENGSLIERVERLERDVKELRSKLLQAPRSARRGFAFPPDRYRFAGGAC